jgi:hypothetical protein
MPSLELGVYLINYLFEVGPVMAGGAGPTAITHGELRAWQANLGIELEPWECRFLRRLSREYVNELQRAEKIDAKAPWQPEDYVPDLAGVAQRMRSAIERMAASD